MKRLLPLIFLLCLCCLTASAELVSLPRIPYEEYYAQLRAQGIALPLSADEAAAMLPADAKRDEIRLTENVRVYYRLENGKPVVW